MESDAANQLAQVLMNLKVPQAAVPPSRAAQTEALSLSSDIMKNIELSELPLVNIALKTSRLARLLNDFDAQRIYGV